MILGWPPSKIVFGDGKWFQTRRFLWEFPIGSYVKLTSAVAAILVGILKYWTELWKRTTQESFQQSLVEIGSVVSEEKIFFKFHPPYFNFDEIVIGWFSSKNLSGDSALRPRWPPQPNLA
jgi:hypothetical protein